MSIDDIAKLPENWNDNGSSAPSSLLIFRAKTFSKILGDGWSCFPIAGDPMGIQFEKENKDVGYMEFEIYEDRINFWSDRCCEIEVITMLLEDYREIINGIKDVLINESISDNVIDKVMDCMKKYTLRGVNNAKATFKTNFKTLKNPWNNMDSCTKDEFIKKYCKSIGKEEYLKKYFNGEKRRKHYDD